ncbi:hypothetical protein [Methyloversatilis sp.]|uniref:hypothetical protein n=1 Tax=Methyloversatilis sp. TaxID=2569862 RepID=UPI0035AE6E27
MKYADGQEVCLGDRIRLGSDDYGVVVCSIDSGQYSSQYPEAEWSYLKKGVLIQFPQLGLIHCLEWDVGLELISRESSGDAPGYLTNQ